VYNVRVADFHTYFVGCDEWGFSVWAHNSCYVAEEVAPGVFKLKRVDTGAYVKGTMQDGSLIRPQDVGDLVGSKAEIEALAKTFTNARKIGNFKPGQGFPAVYDAETGKLTYAPSKLGDGPGTAKGETGWVDSWGGGHGSLSSELGGNQAKHAGFTIILRENGLQIKWKSNSVNLTAEGGLVPLELRPEIVKSIEKATGMKVIEY
jgi:hypothetical protein